MNKELEHEVNEEIFKKRLGVEINSTKPNHRIFSKNAENHRPIILRLANFSDKNKILTSCFELKGT